MHLIKFESYKIENGKKEVKKIYIYMHLVKFESKTEQKMANYYNRKCKVESMIEKIKYDSTKNRKMILIL